MKISSFDIICTCLVRKCGAPENRLDVFSLRVFNGEVEEWVRQEFVAARRIAECKISQENPHYTLKEIWDKFGWTHPQLKSKDELCQLEQELEREMLVPVLSMREKVNECRKHGDKIIFISDMYLSSEFLIDTMREHGFYQEGDTLYVSCECAAEKRTGELFKYIKEKEGVKYFWRWHHYGDNKIGDYKIPRKLGIRCTLINHEYTPYQKQWKDNDYSLGFKYPSILAGLGRALHYSTEWTTHTDFVLDLIAPFYCSLVYRMMKDAEQKGIKRLYFCARDAYMMYLIAQKYQPLFPGIESHFLYISRQALYNGNDEAKIAYYKSIGLATENDYVGIVDIRSSGRTIVELNELLLKNGCKSVRGYFYMCYNDAVYQTRYFYDDVYTEVSGRYNTKLLKFNEKFWSIWENFMPMNTLPRTIGYAMNDQKAVPLFEQDETSSIPLFEQDKVNNRPYWTKIHTELISKYVDTYIGCGVVKYSNQIFALSTHSLYHFFDHPSVCYLNALTDLYGGNILSKEMLPYVKRISIWSIILKKYKKTYWRDGTLAFSPFGWFVDVYRHFRY